MSGWPLVGLLVGSYLALAAGGLALIWWRLRAEARRA